jgi:hypothetical protein
MPRRENPWQTAVNRRQTIGDTLPVTTSRHQKEVLASAADELVERNKRKKNLVVFGMPNSKKNEAKDRKNNDELEIEKILKYINGGKKPDATIIRFKPKENASKPSPVLIKFKDERVRNEILKNAKKLRIEQTFNNTFINPYLTESQQYINKQQKINLTYFNDNNHSRIDHILVNKNCAENCITVQILDNATNTSDHLALQVKLKLNIESSKKENESTSVENSEKNKGLSNLQSDQMK